MFVKSSTVIQQGPKGIRPLQCGLDHSVFRSFKTGSNVPTSMELFGRNFIEASEASPTFLFSDETADDDEFGKKVIDDSDVFEDDQDDPMLQDECLIVFMETALSTIN